MGGKKIASYQQEIEVVTKPLRARAEYYRDKISEIRKLIIAQFLNEKRVQKLTQVAVGDQIPFSFNLVKEAMEKCLIDNQELIAASPQRSLVSAFDENVFNSGLGLKIEKEFYIFAPEKAYTPLAQTFMQQFACVLNVYRQCLEICEVYSAIHWVCQSISIEPLKNHLEEAAKYNALDLNQEINLMDLYHQVTKVKNEIYSLLKAATVRENLESFKERIDVCSAQLRCILDASATYLETAYKTFPNDVYLWMFHDRSFHSLLKNISRSLFTEGYTETSYLVIGSKLDIKREGIEVIKQEIDHFNQVTSAQNPLLKIELLKKAGKLITKTQINIQAKLAELGIELIQAPTRGLFSNSEESINSMYNYLASLANYQQQDGTEDNFAYNSDESEDETEECGLG